MSEIESTNRQNQYVLLYAMIGFCIIFIASYASRIMEHRRAEREVALWEERIHEANARKWALMQTLTEVQGTSYMDRVARDELRLTLEGDEVIVVLPTVNESAALPTHDTGADILVPEKVEEPNWQQWLALFRDGL